jgi:two-component system, sensor histidine kinase and response regulator
MAIAQPKILIVDDEPDLLDITASYLEMEGYTALTALNGPAALEILKTTTPDMIISDITMPGMSGFDLFEKVRANSSFQNTPFVFLSGHTDLEHVMMGKEIGSDDYLMKPFEPEMLISTIKGKLKRRQQISESMTHQIEQLKNQLLHLISHEMRTPLTSILGATELLANGRETLSPDDFKGFLEMLKAGTKRLNNMVEDFLLVVRIESGEVAKEIDFRESSIAPRAVVDRVLMTFEETRKYKNIGLALKVQNESVHLCAQQLQIEYILSRLIDNAFKFSPTGSTITIATRADSEGFTFSITDSGMGIPKSKQGGLFGKFYQVNRESQEQQGAGLGLYVAKKLAEFNKFEIWCESEEGKGATFYLTIPKKVS